MAVKDETVAVRGLAPLIRDFSRMSKTASRELRSALAEVAAPVALDVKFRLGPYGPREPRGVRVAVRQRGIAVRQGLRKSKNLSARRSNFGALQMERAFLPALEDNKGIVDRRVEEFLDRFTGDGLGGMIL